MQTDFSWGRRPRRATRATLVITVVSLAVAAISVAITPFVAAAQGARGQTPAQSPGEPQEQPPPADLDSLSAEVDRLFDAWHRPDAPGAVALVIRGGETVHAKGYGMANLEHGVPLSENSIFDIASVSKQFGAFAIALLDADGRLSIDDPVHLHIPELHDFGAPVTLRHLMHHTGGIRDWPGTLAMGGWDYQDVMSFDQILRMTLHQRELNFEPNSAYAYSNTGYNLLAEVVARVSGQSFRAFTEERVFRPLGMTSTHFQDDHAEVIRGRADSYRVVGGGAAGGGGPGGQAGQATAPRGYRNVANQLTALGSSSLHTTAADLALWVANFADPVVGAGRALDLLHQRGILNDGDTIPYAGGQSLSSYRGSERWSHTGSWAGYRTVLLRHPTEDFAVIVLANRADANPSQLANRITDLYLEGILEPVEEGGMQGGGGPGAPGAGTGGDAPWSPDRVALSEYEGDYWSDELLTGYLLRVDEEGALIASHFRTGDRTFRPDAPDLFRAPTFGEIRFIRDENGAVIGFTANQDRIRGLRFDRVR